MRQPGAVSYISEENCKKLLNAGFPPKVTLSTLGAKDVLGCCLADGGKSISGKPCWGNNFPTEKEIIDFINSPKSYKQRFCDVHEMTPEKCTSKYLAIRWDGRSRVIEGFGDTPEEATEKLKKRINEITVNNKEYYDLIMKPREYFSAITIERFIYSSEAVYSEKLRDLANELLILVKK